MRLTIVTTDHSFVLDKFKLKVNQKYLVQKKRINSVDVIIRGLILNHNTVLNVRGSDDYSS